MAYVVMHHALYKQGFFVHFNPNPRLKCLPSLAGKLREYKVGIPATIHIEIDYYTIE